MAIRLITFFMIGAVIFTLFTLFLPDFLGYFWVALSILLIIGFAYLSFYYLKKIITLISAEKRNH
ncbi:hypothetical protein [Halobacillus sp. A5]|uniref:hypothetical protein n=1 Tax=Halobacillus sp. A5 TaxID=2880263 RepID=UPI0020A6B72B|nr:hypothetical protein [Halobacillus sp. A5]MCP3026516.1 hypothetical protein [Halobacillus sp. A5]